MSRRIRSDTYRVAPVGGERPAGEVSHADAFWLAISAALLSVRKYTSVRHPHKNKGGRVGAELCSVASREVKLSTAVVAFPHTTTSAS